MESKGFEIANFIISLVAAGASVVQAIDSVKNGDRRAILAGTACGRQLGMQMSNGAITLNGRQIKGVDKNGNYIDENGQIIK